LKIGPLIISSAGQYLEHFPFQVCIPGSRVSISTKLKLYNTCILPVFLYGSECWAVTKVDACRIDALDQWCLRTLLALKWHQFVRNDELRRLTKQPNVTAIIQSRHLSLFRHIAHMYDDTDAEMILTAHPPENWRRTSSHHVVEHRPARSQNLKPHIEWSSRPGSEPSSVEADVYIWRCAHL